MRTTFKRKLNSKEPSEGADGTGTACHCCSRRGHVCLRRTGQARARLAGEGNGLRGVRRGSVEATKGGQAHLQVLPWRLRRPGPGPRGARSGGGARAGRRPTGSSHPMFYVSPIYGTWHSGPLIRGFGHLQSAFVRR